MIHNVLQVPTNDVPCYCYECLKNSISKATSNYSSVCYKYVLPTKNPNGRHHPNKDKTNSLRYSGRGENIHGFVDKNNASNKGVKLNYNSKENAEGEIDYYNYRMEKKEHVLDQNSIRIVKNLIDYYLMESTMPNSDDLSSQDSLCENTNPPKCLESDETYSLSSGTSSSISKSDIRSSASCSLKFKDKKSEEIDEIFDTKHPSNQEMGLTNLFSFNLNECPIAGNEECSKIKALKNFNAEVFLNNDSTVPPENYSPCDKQSMKTCELKIREEKTSLNSGNFVCHNTPVVNSRQNQQIYTLLFSDKTKTHLDEHDKFSNTSTQENLSKNFRNPEISSPACRLGVKSNEFGKSGIDSSAHGNASYSEGDYKPFVIKELWRPLTFSSDNNMRTKSRQVKIIKNKEGMLSRNANKNFGAKSRIKPSTTALSQKVTSKKIDAKNVLENEVKRKDNRKNENGKNSSLSFKSQLNLNDTRSDEKSFCKEILSDAGTNENENPKLKCQAKQALPKQEVGNIKRKWKFDSHSSRSKLTDKVVVKCKGDFSPKSNSCNEVDAIVESPAKRRKSLQSKIENKKHNHAVDVDGVKKCTKSVKKYKTVITRKLCFIKRKVYIQPKVQKYNRRKRRSKSRTILTLPVCEKCKYDTS
ncbi:hypothetical protein LSTR_LSTR002569 [Laodelphax striatellus]|uniref:Uncharacterized protein n=1 Tax=Laodelphax striatellus TaxID=195883 RepID=A0A482XLA3_LAOST|nr:hypothetical protein LSTR_LSTR002569 [Laodelphax striatellus]